MYKQAMYIRVFKNMTWYVLKILNFLLDYTKPVEPILEDCLLKN